MNNYVMPSVTGGKVKLENPFRLKPNDSNQMLDNARQAFIKWRHHQIRTCRTPTKRLNCRIWILPCVEHSKPKQKQPQRRCRRNKRKMWKEKKEINFHRGIFHYQHIHTPRAARALGTASTREQSSSSSNDGRMRRKWTNVKQNQPQNDDGKNAMNFFLKALTMCLAGSALCYSVICWASAVAGAIVYFE